MVKKWEKKLAKLPVSLSKNLEIVVEDVINGDFEHYDIEKLSGFGNLFRIRKGKIRIIFSKIEGKGKIEHIDFRGDIYKKY